MNDYKELIIASGKRMYNANLTVGTWGNISVRDPKTNLVYLTPSGMNYETCTVDDVVVCNLKGEIVEGNRLPTIEKDLHIGVLNARADVNAVIHTHPIYSLVFSALGEEIPLIIDEAAQFLGGTVKTADYALPGTQELADNCVELIKDANACLLHSHGAVCVGANMDMAFLISTILEQTAQVYYMAKCIGKPKAISDENIVAMADIVKHKYGQNRK